MASIKVFWEKLKTRLKKPGWLTWQSFLVIAVVVFFVVVMIWSEPLGKLFAPATKTPSTIRFTPTVKPGTPTPIPAELLESATQTNGIILGSVILVLIIVIGAVSRMLIHRNKRKSS
jgi:hypothetical protein